MGVGRCARVPRCQIAHRATAPSARARPADANPRVSRRPVILVGNCAAASSELEGLFALLDDTEEESNDDKAEDASSIDSLLAFESEELFAIDDSADGAISSALDELLGDDELLDFDELAAAQNG